MLLLMCGDVLAVLGSLGLSLTLHYDGRPFLQVYRDYFRHHVHSLPITLALYVAIFAAFRLYRYAWRFASLETVWSVVSASTLGLVGLVALQYLVDKSVMSWAALVIFWMMSILLVGGVRIMLRLASLSRSYGGRAVRILQRDLRPRRVVILGGGSSGARLLNALHEERSVPYEVVGILDDNPEKHGVYIRGARVLGPLNLLYKLLAEKAVDEVFSALPEASGAEIREYAMACRTRKVPVKIIPALGDVLNGKTLPHIEDISVEDLLRRLPVHIDVAEIGDFLTGKRVLVTGAGGSIGSELCRQMIGWKPAALILLGHGENSIHRIYQELRASHPNLSDRLRMVIGSVADENRINQVFHSHRPQVVFHAAAHKHVPIMEANVLEAVQNNVLGTHYVADACGRYKVSRLVVISSDKAVNPSCVMGATKRLCEKLVRAMVSVYRETTYVTVRFGNVLGSRGSVVPLFHEQIKRGGPVTVTHPEMTRYFMSIPEAVQLVLQAGAVGMSGELYLLDMGEPVKILDLARDMIRLCGQEPDIDIPVVFTGPRPGEKLYEELTSEDEQLEPAFCDGLSIVRCSNCYTAAEVMDIVRHSQQLISRGDSSEVYGYLDQLIPGFVGRTLLGRA
jgi:FlaA1/EpsC-like NDP-sugar epimerase